jgi:ankyrin repeat protein
MPGIFISYRREDTAGHAGRLYDQLCAHFGEEQVFMDVSAIQPGEDFAKVIENRVHACDAAVVLMGRNWLTKRLTEPGDFVFLEISLALQRNIRVVPVLVEDARMPAVTDLPEPLAPLARRQAIELTDAAFHEDVQRLIHALDPSSFQGEPELKEMQTRSRPSPLLKNERSQRRIWAAVMAIAVVMLAGFAFWFTRGKSRASSNSAAEPPALVKAIEYGRMDEVRALVAKHADVNAAASDGTTPLMRAAEGSAYLQNNAPAVDLLLKSGAHVDAEDSRGRTALFRSAGEGKVDATRLLLTHKADPNHKANDGSTPLLTAVTYGRLPVVQALLGAGADVDLADSQGSTPLALACEGNVYAPNNVPLVQALLDKDAHVDTEDSRGRTPLHRAAQEGKVGAMQLLLDRKAKINAQSGDGSTPLLGAVTYGRVAAVNLLLRRGADVDLADAQGSTPLMIAAEGTAYLPNNAPMIATLIGAHANVNAQDSRGRTPIYRAAMEGRTEAMLVLLDNKADPNLQAFDNSTPLLEAVTYSRFPTATLLLDHGANVNLADGSGRTPLMQAAETTPFSDSLRDFMKLLLKHGAQTSLADNRGRTALSRATESKNAAAVGLLTNK